MINVAIDGPAGAGKSTIAKAAAKELGFIYVDTGALYRAVAYNAVKTGAIDDEQKIINMLDSTKVELKYVNGVQAVYLNGEDVSAFIRTPEISMGASKVSAIPQVRAFLLNLQREIASKNNVIMDKCQKEQDFFSNRNRLHGLACRLKMRLCLFRHSKGCSNQGQAQRR